MTISSEPHRLSSCHHHPTKPVIGFCTYCLCERLAGIESSSSSPATAAGHDQVLHLPLELRSTKSCSCSVLATAISEPRRRSCEVCTCSSLWDLFNLDNEKKGLNRKFEVELGNFSYEIREEEQIRGLNKEIRVCGDGFAVDEEEEEETKTMKVFIDLELQGRRNTGRDFRDIAGSFWEAASAFSKKLRKWRRKQKMRKHNGSDHNVGVGFTGLKNEKPGSRRMRELHLSDP